VTTDAVHDTGFLYMTVCERRMDGERTKLLDSLQELSNILETGLDRESLSILLELTEAGVNPEALAALVKELRKRKDKDDGERLSFFA